MSGRGAPTCFAVVTGGGTSGHVLPALAIAEGLVAAGHEPATIHYIGAQRGIETRLVPPTPFPHTFLDVIGLQRRLDRSNLLFPLKLVRATARAFRLLRRLRPRVVVSVGGYASLPAVIAARLLRTPVVVVSYDRRPGQSSRLTARFAAASAVAFPDSPLPRARYTGAPLRQAILAVDPARDRDAARGALGLPLDRFVVAVSGGSLGSGVLNEAVAGLVAAGASRQDLAVRHIVGERFLGQASSARAGDSGILYQVIGYEEQMPLVYAAADVVVGACRREHDRRARRGGRGVDPRAVGRRGGGSPDRQRPGARRPGRGGRRRRERAVGRPAPGRDRPARRRSRPARRDGPDGPRARRGPPEQRTRRPGRRGGGEVIPADQVPVAPLDLSTPGRFHVVGVGGPGMSAIALVLAEMGHTVSGSDVRELAVLERLRAAGVTVAVGHDRSLVHGVDAVTASTAIPERNIELVEAHATGVAVLRRAGMLASICAQARSLGVAGTHGKTTTSSMLMLVLADAGLRPSFVIGGDVADMGTGAQWTGGEWLVVEADESDLTHLELPLHGTILTNVDTDHLEHYGTFERIVEGFEQYLSQIHGPKVLCADDPICARFAAELRRRRRPRRRGHLRHRRRRHLPNRRRGRRRRRPVVHGVPPW